MGHYPQVKEVIYNYMWEEPNFIGNLHHEETKIIPAVPTPVLYAKSNLTDLIHISAMGFTNKLLVSGRLKELFLEYRNSDMQFFKAPIIKNGELIEDYWILNFHKFNHEFIDIPASRIYYEKKSSDYVTTYKTIKEYVKFSNLKEFEEKLSEVRVNGETLSIEKLELLHEKINQDFFMIRYSFGGLYYVSEKLKQEIEQRKYTGVEFRPIELSFNEWLYGGERDRVYGKA